MAADLLEFVPDNLDAHATSVRGDISSIIFMTSAIN